MLPVYVGWLFDTLFVLFLCCSLFVLGIVMALSFKQLRHAHLRLGARGERLACRAMREMGMVILCRNYTGKRGEIDIIALEDRVLCFVEVKTRRRQGLYRPSASVGRTKQENIVGTARRYLRELRFPSVSCRFDIVELIVDGWRVRDARYIRSAFSFQSVRDRRRKRFFPFH